jgi:transposase-like protein
MRKTHSPAEKTKIVVEVLRGERTINEIAAEHNIHPNQLSRWKSEAIAGMPSLFENGRKKERQAKKEHEAEIELLYQQIGKLTTQLEWAKKKSGG